MTRRVDTKTGGRDATTRHIFGQSALSVGMPNTAPPNGWKWVALTDVARMESGHTPSRQHPEYWDGDIPWIGIRDAKTHHGETIHKTIQTTNELGIQNSSARVLPQGTVCLSRTASVGYVVVMGLPMATSQDFANWICSDQLDPRFLVYLFLAEEKSLLRFASGAIHQTIYYPELKAFHVCLPPLAEQQRIVAILDEAFAGLATATANAEKNLKNARELFDSHSKVALESEHWIRRRLEEVVDHRCSLSYGIVQPGDDRPAGLPIVRPVDLTSKLIRLEGLKRIEPSLAQAYGRTKLIGGELLLCVRGSTGAISIASEELVGANVTRGIVPILFDTSKVMQRFGYYALRSEPMQRQIREKTYGAALMQINIRDLRNLTIPVPPREEQRRIAADLETIAEDTFRLREIYQKKLSELRALKEALLRRAFAGEMTSQSSRAIKEAAE